MKKNGEIKPKLFKEKKMIGKDFESERFLKIGNVDFKDSMKK